MKITIYRGTKFVGGTFIEIKTNLSRVLIDVGFPLFFNGHPIETRIGNQPVEKLLSSGILPLIKGLYKWDEPSIDAVIISRAHLDHYGLIKYIHSSIPIYISEGSNKLVEITQRFKLCDQYPISTKIFQMNKPFTINDIVIKPYLMDHCLIASEAFDSAAFEVTAQGKTVLYTSDFRCHDEKFSCMRKFIDTAKANADVMLVERRTIGTEDENIITEAELENTIIREINSVARRPVLFQSSCQNIERIVSFYKAASALGKIFVVDAYTANILYELHHLGNVHVPYPGEQYKNINVFFPLWLTKNIFNDIGPEYANRFSSFHMSKSKLEAMQENVVMMVRPSMLMDLKKCNLSDGLYFYSLWQGYRNCDYQQEFEQHLKRSGFTTKFMDASGHVKFNDFKEMISSLNPSKIIPINTSHLPSFMNFTDKTASYYNSREFEV